MSPLVFADEALDEATELFFDTFDSGDIVLVLRFDFADAALEDPGRDE